ncbi:hypothetical protein [Streptacidiphilus pinicola]|uniref:hypothetical protein n=1 Tax=Streptacidiphilus pinicola TaxID=2219663 RepID=UPI0010583051|nr:hypothetical protein [Streptacidiphilus pinicola]
MRTRGRLAIAATDSRVCPQTGGNNLSLADAAAHFELVLPVHATHLVFSASVGGLQGRVTWSCASPRHRRTSPGS